MPSYKQEMRDPEPSNHPDERMKLTLKDVRKEMKDRDEARVKKEETTDAKG